MKAFFHNVGDVRLKDVSDLALELSTDAIVRIATSVICGTAIHKRQLSGHATWDNTRP